MTPEALATVLDSLGPFEPEPLLAVAVSGGADSLALALLADAWARKRGGRAVALTVDHALRPESADEARQVGAWLAARDIPHVILRRDGLPFTGDIQAAARAARYALLTGWCRANGCLHLLLAHHQGDQAETLLLRLARGSGVQGLSAMAPLSFHPDCRLLRPLLGVPKAALQRCLKDLGQPWIEDPSNRNPAFARVRMRGLSDVLAAEGATPVRLAATAAHLGRARQALDQAVDELLAASVAPSRWGWLRLDPRPFRAAPAEIALRALGRIVGMIGGGAYPPRLEGLERCLALLGQATTLGGVRFRPETSGLILAVRENRALPSLPLAPGDSVLWDGRFRATAAADTTERLVLGPLGNDRVPGISRAEEKNNGLPPAARASLPAFRRGQEVVFVPFFASAQEAARGLSCTFAPALSLGSVGFRLALEQSSII